MNARIYPMSILITAILFLSACTDLQPSKKLSPLLDKYVEYWNTGEFQGISEVLHPDFELRMTPKFEPEKGIENFKEDVIMTRTAYPDFHIEVIEWIYDSDKIAGRWIITATNTGPGSHPATGKKVEIMGMSIIHFENGKIKDEWIASNNYYWLKQLGFTLVAPSFEEE